MSIQAHSGAPTSSSSSSPRVTASSPESLPSNAPSSPSPASPSPSADDIEDLLLDCRYGSLSEVRAFVDKFGVGVGAVDALANARDERGNNVLHMCAANGHDDILSYILTLPNLPPSLLSSKNDAGNTPLHWACLNAQLSCAKLLVGFTSPPPPPTSSPSPNGGHGGQPLGPALILARNDAGHTPLGEAELNGWEEGARWLVSVMELDTDLGLDGQSAGSGADADAEAEGEEEREADVEGAETVDDKRTDGGAQNGKSRSGENGVGSENRKVSVEVELARLRVSEDSVAGTESRS